MSEQDRRFLEDQAAFDPDALFKLAIFDEQRDNQATLINMAIQRILNYYNPCYVSFYLEYYRVTTNDVATVIEETLNSPYNQIVTWIHDDQRWVHLPYQSVGLMAVHYDQERPRIFGETIYPENSLFLDLTYLRTRATGTEGYPATEMTAAIQALSDHERVYGHREISLTPEQVLNQTQDLKLEINGPFYASDLAAATHFALYQRPINRNRVEYFASIQSSHRTAKFVIYDEDTGSGGSMIEGESPIRGSNQIISFTRFNLPTEGWVNFLENKGPPANPLPFVLRRLILELAIPHRIRFENLNLLRRWIMLTQYNYFTS